jgi:hypothetical protein
MAAKKSGKRLNKAKKLESTKPLRLKLNPRQ